jgi:F0F1-type ATP synthase assembly protein I
MSGMSGIGKRVIGFTRKRTRPRPDRLGQEADDSAGYTRALGLSTGWAVFSYLIAGMVAYGAIGWLISRATHIAILFPVGMLAGLGISLVFVIYRYGRAETEAARSKQRTSGMEQTGDR